MEIKTGGRDRKYLFSPVIERYVNKLAKRHNTTPATIIMIGLYSIQEGFLATQINLKLSERIAEILHKRTQGSGPTGRPQTLPRMLHNDTKATDKEYGGLANPPAAEILPNRNTSNIIRYELRKMMHDKAQGYRAFPIDAENDEQAARLARRSIDFGVFNKDDHFAGAVLLMRSPKDDKVVARWNNLGDELDVRY